MVKPPVSNNLSERWYINVKGSNKISIGNLPSPKPLVGKRRERTNQGGQLTNLYYFPGFITNPTPLSSVE